MARRKVPITWFCNVELQISGFEKMEGWSVLLVSWIKFYSKNVGFDPNTDTKKNAPSLHILFENATFFRTDIRGIREAYMACCKLPITWFCKVER